ncbi:amidohydrolase [Luteimonas sp. S4-F44]|uniref:amidohydrolase n=1 Tax=Luteimonas sp. S4-F44 TaxID=2925842 RepID=UPI001F532BD6|nr:amidohydrolase [Luteimonas sp. S4-F44]UNK42680.1 amidohydrolase [Luteimonas sp. S4-F44]
MRPRFAVPLLACLFAAIGPVHAQDALDPTQAAAALQDRLVAWRRDLHRHPELGNQETRTAALVADHLQRLGLEPRTGIGPTGVVAVLKGGRPGPRIALRADMDALPVTERTDLPFASTARATYRGQEVGVMHACGHDMHVAILMGVAQALAEHRDQLAGEVVFVFQPAEEGPPEPGETFGAQRMLDEGAFADGKPDAILGLHVWAGLHTGQIGFRSGPSLASADEWALTITGKQTHGSRPWDGIDPITVGAQVLLATQSMLARQINTVNAPVVLTAGQFQSGVRFNIIPDDARLVGTLRTYDAAVREDVIARFDRIASDYAHAAGATAKLDVVNNAPATVNDPDLARRVLPALQAAVGTDNVLEMPLVTVAEDFSQFANVVPGAYFFVGTTPQGQDPATMPINHSPHYAPDEAALQIGVRALLRATLDLQSGATDG